MSGLTLPRGVIFDMDGVLVDSEPYIAEAVIQMFAEKGVPGLTRHDFLPFVGTGEDRFLSGVAALRGAELDLAKDKARTYQLYLELIKGKLGPLPGVHDFIKKCRDKGLKIAVASSADEIKVHANLYAIGLTPESFDAVMTGGDVERKKPFPDIFLEAARRMGLPCSDCLVIEDAVAGVDAAKAAGARCLALTTTFAPEALAAADWITETLATAPDVVFAW